MQKKHCNNMAFNVITKKNQCDVWDKDVIREMHPTRLEVPEPDDEQLVKAKTYCEPWIKVI